MQGLKIMNQIQLNTIKYNKLYLSPIYTFQEKLTHFFDNISGFFPSNYPKLLATASLSLSQGCFPADFDWMDFYNLFGQSRLKLNFFYFSRIFTLAPSGSKLAQNITA